MWVEQSNQLMEFDIAGIRVATALALALPGTDNMTISGVIHQ